MRIGVIGAGAIGGTFAALLDRTGHEVEVTARGEQLDAIRDGGLVLRGAWGEHTARIEAGPELRRAPEIALLAVKAGDAVDAATRHAHVLRGVPVVVIQNGLRGPQALEDVLAASPLLGGLSMIAASALEPGVVTVTTPGTTVLAADTASRDELELVAGVLREAVSISVADDLVGAQWAKLVVNQLNFGPAICGASMQAVLMSPAMRRAVVAAMRETIRVGRVVGATFTGLPALSPGVLRLIDRAPLWLAARILGPRFAANMGDVPNLGSTLQSIRRGRGTEIDELSGAVVEQGARVGVPTPVNRRVVELVHDVEAGAAFLPPDRAAALLLRD